MAEEKIKSGATIQLNIRLLLNESEARALNGLTVYGDDEFIRVFYEKLGKAYMEEHEKGLRSLFKTIREELPQHLSRVDDARDAFNGTLRKTAKG